ncbi:ABC transporter substrate-binding protein [Paenibacillus macquariensis]|uniref:Iron complex transport system substrate-binding protein n=1 Tax=Paenibacillus macquariensis TaxID=948756 RepID=A0ABY1JMN6_9BACL|nr:ABC transporter substrate-binding protein [Paenibacillus macquariensis]MEC0092278.1 ABC transporter substrate-binding protein [Paenibacillus macquariensis]OAB37178.1 ABC transporter substrate-binding protein [Paenibacillus macquariensis subsp. macquariensis]SIQ47166.1 iron complex transport system substrate-binding protein [Paenibacillus macquariensis]
MFHINTRLNKVMRKRASVWLCLALTGSLLAACGSNNSVDTTAQKTTVAATTTAVPVDEEKTVEPAAERILKDDLGNEVKIPATTQRVFAPYLEDSLLKLGVKPVVQWSNGKMGHEYLKEELKDVPKLDFSGGLPSPEVLMSYNPDLIILHTASYAKDGMYEKYAKIAPTYVFNNAAGDMDKTLGTLGELLGKSTEADSVLKAYDQKVNEAKEKIAASAGGKKVAIIRFAPRGVSLMGGKYLCGYVLNQQLGIGMTKLTENENSLDVSMEVLPQIDADYIFVINAYDQGTARLKEMTDSAIWKSIPAVKQGHVYEVNDEYWLGSGLIAYEKIIDDTVKILTK